ncbi:MAG: hypothetical protein HQK77_15850 [Desulfobacterales bacterium]|nr:hypothetical protein [Desulfobacterales bacterium]
MLKKLEIILICQLSVFCNVECQSIASLLNTCHKSFTFNSFKASNNTIGTILYDPNSENFQLISTDSGGKTDQETISLSNSQLTNETPFIVYDSQSNPHIFFSQKGLEMIHLYKGDTGLWTEEVIFTLDKTAYPNLFCSIAQVGVGQDDSFHILSSDFYSIFYISNQHGHWDTTPQLLLELPTEYVNIKFGWRISIRGNPSMAIDSANHIHVVYSTIYETQYITNSPGYWLKEDIFRDQNMDDWLAETPSIAIDHNGNPAIAATEMNHALGGSVIYAKLTYLYRTAPNSWTVTTVAESADEYSGTDGNRFTGINPQLFFDAMNRPLILFSDMASSHNENGWNYTKNGQIRLASLDGSIWDIITIYRQSPYNGEMQQIWIDQSSTEKRYTIFGLEIIRLGTVYELDRPATYNFLCLTNIEADSVDVSIE